MPISFSPSEADEPGDSDTACCMPVTTVMTAARPGAQAAGKAWNLCVCLCVKERRLWHCYLCFCRTENEKRGRRCCYITGESAMGVGEKKGRERSVVAEEGKLNFDSSLGSQDSETRMCFNITQCLRPFLGEHNWVKTWNHSGNHAASLVGAYMTSAR